MMTGDEWWRLLPSGTSGDGLRILAARGARAFANGFVSLLLPIYLIELGFNSLADGAIVASTLMGAAATESGARTSLFVPELDPLFLAVRAGLLGFGASIQIFRPTP